MRSDAYLHVDFVSTKHDRDAFTHALQITMPVWHIFVCDPGGHVEHDNTTLALDVVSIAKTTELFLSSGIPDVERDVTVIGLEVQRVNLNTKRGCDRGKTHKGRQL